MIINNELCDKCGRCVLECPKNAISENEGIFTDDTEVIKCTCPKTDCRWHGNCKQCVALHNSGNDHIPACLRHLIHGKLNALAGVIEMTITTKEN